MTHIPVACSLSDAQLRDRRSGILRDLSERVIERRELSDGAGFRFHPSAEVLTLLAEVIDLERRCCPFLRFRLTVEPEQGPLWLELSGPPGTAEFLSDLLG